MFVLVVVLLIAAFVVGVVVREPLLHALGLHDDAPTAAAGQKQLWTCGMHPQVIQDKPGNCPICGMALEPLGTDAASGGTAAETGAIRIDPVIVQNMGVRTAKVTTGSITRTIRATGSLVQPTDALTDVNLRISGWIEKLYADTEGKQVKKGDKLFDLYSPELQVAVEELQAARRATQNLPQDVGDPSRSVASTLLQAGERKLRLWGLDDKQIAELTKADRPPRTITFYSPTDGEIGEKMIVQGAAVQAGERALRIVNRGSLWLDAQLFAMDIPQVKVGQKVTAQVEGIPGGVEGEVSFISPSIDPVTRTASVRVVLENPELQLRPAMFATVEIPVTLASGALVIPREAVLDTGSRQVVFVVRPDSHFAPREVKLGASGSDGMTQVVSGLDASDTVVTSGQFLMDAESRMKEAVAKHLSKGLLAPPGEHQQHGGQATKRPSDEATKGRRDRGEAATSSTSPVASPAWNAAVDRAIVQYLKLAETLGAVQTGDTPLEVAELVAAADALAKAAADDNQRSLATYLQEGGKALAGKPLDEQRESFKALSDVAIELATGTPANQKLYVLYCPMAKASWLQKTDQRANPYYATEMKQCAVVKREIPAR